MHTTTPRTQPEAVRQSARRGTRLGVALVVALVVVAAAVVGGWLVLRDTGSSEIATVEAAIDAYNAYDFDAYVGYLAEGGTVGGAVVGGPEWREVLAADEAVGGQVTLGECELIDTTLTCLETYQETLLTAQAGLVLTYEAEYTFNDEGLIESREYDFQLEDFEAFDEALGRWMVTAHPEVYETYYIPGYYTPKYKNMLTPDGVAELSPIIAEFIAQSDEYPLNP